MTPSETPSPLKRRLRYFLISVAAFAVTVALFYAEEDWRGKRAWDNCKRALRARGAKLNWADYIPGPVPDIENIFGVPEMQKWFVGQGRNELSEKLRFPGWDSPAHMVIARLTIGLPGATPPIGSAVLQWGDPKARIETGRLIEETIGPVVVDLAGPFYTKQPPGEIRAVQIFLQCQTQPGEKEIQQFMPDPFVVVGTVAYPQLKVERTGGGSYNVTMPMPGTVAEFLKWNEQLEPEFTLIRSALQRPYARMAGDYRVPFVSPIPNFVAIRTLSQRLAAMSKCHMALGQPGKALDALTLMHQLCRVLECRPTGQPMTLVAAMINVAVTGLYVDTIEEGIRLKVWQEPQLTELEEQLKEINLHLFVANAMVMEREGVLESFYVEFTKRVGLSDRLKPRNFSSYGLRPRGWFYQNMVVCANLEQMAVESFAPADQAIVPHKIEAVRRALDGVVRHPSPFNLFAAMAIPNTERAGQTLVRNQTMANQAQIVCALERHRLAHGEYPETLDALAPRFIDKIPTDIVGGLPPHYRRNADGTFLLYSIGWSERDDGGQTNSDLVWPEK